MMPVEHAAVEDAISGGGLHGEGRDQAWLDVEPVAGDAITSISGVEIIGEASSLLAKGRAF